MRNPAFSAVLLAGGKSSRMGRDKASVLVDGRPMWERQIATLQALRPWKIFISGKRDGPYADAEIEILEDARPDCGPLAGIEAACWRMQTPLLCVLAVDLPWMTAAFLTRLIEKAGNTGCGLVPQNGDAFEPLAAVYPSAMYPLIAETLSAPDRSLQRLIRRGVEQHLIIPHAVTAEERPLFRNINTPGDLAGL